MNGMRAGQARCIAWVAGPLVLAAAAVAAVAFARGRSRLLLGATLAVLLGVPLLWLVISSLWPARADRTCPRCGAEALERTDPDSTVGLACPACGWRDTEESSWLLAEDEESDLERFALRERPPRSSGSSVDSPPPTD